MLTEMRPIEYFKEMVSLAIKRQRVRASETTEFYISNLLASYTSAERFSSSTGEPAAMTFLKALGAGGETRARLLKDLGDISLFTSGFFSDSLSRSLVDVDYYIKMGAASYILLASLHKGGRAGDIASLFHELAQKFPVFVEVLAEVSETTRLTSSKDILRVYERWLRTKSKRAEAMLRELGIEPLDVGMGVQ